MADTCEECGRSMRIDEHTIKAGRYCCKGCEEKAWRRNHTFTCKICGKEFVANTGGYCSKECKRKARLQYEKPIAEKTLEKWEKELRKVQKKHQVRIDKLKEALRSNDPEAMLAARKGSTFKRACGCMFTIVRGAFFLAFLFFFAVGLVNVAKFVRDNGNRSGTNNITVEATSETGVPTPQEEKQDDIKPYVTPDSAVTTQNVSNSAFVPVE